MAIQRLLSLLRPAAKDPRHIVTPDAFEVAPELLGRPLATPWRRGFALLADLLFVFLLTRLGSASAALAVAVVFVLAVTRKAVERRWVRWARRCVALAGSLVLFTGVFVALEWSEPNPYTGMSSAQWTQFGIAMGSQDPEARDAALEEMISDMVEKGTARHQTQAIIDSLGATPEMQGSLQDLIAFGLPGAEPEAEDAPPDPAVLAALLEGYAAALRQDDEARVKELGRRTEDLVAGSATARLEKRVERLRVNARELYAENRDLRDRVENPSFLRLLSTLAADLGLTFGWSGLYFTLFLAWWRGRTPGKRLFGLQVLRLDHRPLSLLISLERFAGYAAGIATGLLGFLQILWDPNRQGLQDKVAGTVVVMERRGADS